MDVLCHTTDVSFVKIWANTDAREVGESRVVSPKKLSSQKQKSLRFVEAEFRISAARGGFMKAVLLYACGDPAQLRYEETGMPKYSDNEVLVKVHATSINPINRKIRFPL
jgi:hypothetical protein